LQLQLGYVKLNPIWRLRVRLPHVYTYFLLGAVDVFTDHLSCSRSVHWNVHCSDRRIRRNWFFFISRPAYWLAVLIWNFCL